MICLSLAGKEFAISKSKNLLYVLAGWEFSSLIMTYYYFNNSKYIYIYMNVKETNVWKRNQRVQVLGWDNGKKNPQKTGSLYITSKGNIRTISKGNCSVYLKRSYWFCQCETTHYPQNSLVGNSMHQQTQINDQR